MEGIMSGEALQFLTRQFETAWKLTSYHLDGLTTAECLWRPASKGLHVQQDEQGLWHSDWPESEAYDLGPPSIAWLTWHLGFWWEMALNHSFGNGLLSREAVLWPGSASQAAAWVGRLHDEWWAVLHQLNEKDLQSAQHTRWPFQDRPFGDLVAWVNIELTKNAAEIGYARFLYAVSKR
jgi:hypothetical protein